MTNDDPLTDGPLPAALAYDDAAWAREILERDVVTWFATSPPLDAHGPRFVKLA